MAHERFALGGAFHSAVLNDVVVAAMQSLVFVSQDTGLVHDYSMRPQGLLLFRWGVPWLAASLGLLPRIGIDSRYQSQFDLRLR